MSGIFGWIPTDTAQDTEREILRAGSALAHRAWHTTDIWIDRVTKASLGKSGIGIFNSEPQPIISSDENLVLFFTGELFYNNFSDLLPDAPAEWAQLPHPQHILKLYQRYGIQAFGKLEGLYQLALFDKNHQMLYISNDHYGSYPMYWTQGKFGLLFGPELKAIINHPQFNKRQNLDALADYIRFQRVLGDKTFFENVHRLRRGSILSYNLSSRNVKLEQYWSFRHIPDIETDFDQAVDTVHTLLVEAVKRNTNSEYSTGVYMSGGIDSRTAAAIAARYKSPLYTLTYGDPASKDFHFAGRIASKINSHHLQFPFNSGSWVQEHADDHLNLTEASHAWLHMHGISTIDAAREKIQIQMNGFSGDHLLNVYARQGMLLEQMKTWDKTAMVSSLFYQMTHRASWPCVTEAEALEVFAKPRRKEMRDRAYESLLQEVKHFSHLPNVKLIDAFKFTNHTMGLTFFFNIFFRSGMEIRMPYLDYNLFNYIQGLPADIRFKGGNLLCLKLLEKAIPEVTHIPNANDDLPPTTHKLKRGYGEVCLRAVRLARRISPEKFKERPSLSVDYEELLRADLKPWAEEILFDPIIEERGIFNPTFLKSIWKRHQSGELHTIGKFAPIISYELFLRKFFD